jgi:hypothetical protein
MATLTRLSTLVNGPDSSQQRNTYHFRYGGSVALSAVAAAWVTNAQDSYVAMMNNEYTLVSIDVIEIVPKGTTPPVSYTQAVGVAGTRSGATPPLPNWLCARATLYTSLGGRQNRGAFCAPGVYGNDIDADELITEGSHLYAAVLAHLGAVYDAFNNSGGDGQWCIFSRKRWSAGGGVVTDWTNDVESYVVHPTVRALRRRRPGS